MSDEGLYLLIAVKPENKKKIVNQIVVALDLPPRKKEVISIGKTDQTYLRYTNFTPGNKKVTVIKKLSDKQYFEPMKRFFPAFLVALE